MADPLSPETLGPGASRAFPRVAGESDAEARRLLAQGYLSLANMSAKAATLAPRRQLENPFRFADVPPGVLPPDALSLAQDAALQDTLKWAADQHDQRQLAFDEQAISFLPALGFAGYQAAFANGYGYLGFSFLSELAQVAEYRIISETIASELTREWIEFKTTTHQGPRNRMPGNKAARIERIEERFEELKVKDRFREVAEIDGLLGRGHLYLDTGDTDERAELQQSIGDGHDSLSRRKVSKEHPLRRIAAIEATWCYPNRYNSTNPLKADWYRPQTWFVMGFEVHVTRLLLFVGREVPDLLKAAYNFGGLSLSQMAKPYVDNWLRTRQAVADLIWSFSNNVLKTDLQTLLQGGVEAEAVLNRVRAFNAIRNNQGTLVINKDTEDWVNVAAPISGLHELQAQAQEHMASVSRIPLVKLLGIQPSGLNASSEGEIRSFYDTIAAYQEKYFREPLTRVLNFVQLSLFDEIDPEITFEFKPLWQLDEVAEAGVQQQRAATRETDIAAGIITPEEAREALADDPKSQYSNIDLDEGEAPGMQGGEEDGEPELDPETGEPIEPDFESEQLGGPKPKTSRLGTQITTRAAEFGSPATGGFGARDVKWKEQKHHRRRDGKFGKGNSSSAQSVFSDIVVDPQVTNKEAAQHKIDEYVLHLPRGLLKESSAKKVQIFDDPSDAEEAILSLLRGRGIDTEGARGVYDRETGTLISSLWISEDSSESGRNFYHEFAHTLEDRITDPSWETPWADEWNEDQDESFADAFSEYFVQKKEGDTSDFQYNKPKTYAMFRGWGW